MTWFKVDDSFYDHPKVFDAPDCAVALWTRAGTWSARNLTDGFVPTGMPARLCDDPDTAVRELVRRGLWTRTSGGYRFHDWGAYQPSRDAVEDLRAKRAEAGRRGGAAKAARRKVDNEMVTTAENRSDDDALANANPDATTSDNKQKPSKRLALASPVAKQNATPTRPDPTRSSGLGRGVPHGGERMRARESPPEPQCTEHQGNPSPPPCGPCADARRAHDRWTTDRAQRIDAAPRCQRHRGQLAHNCAPCRSEQLGAEP